MRNYSDGFLKEKDNNDKNNPNFKFNLTGVMLHIGNAISGHKTAYSKNFLDNNNWYYFNDSSKKKESKRNVLNDPAAFMLFYISDSYKITPERIKKIKELAEKNATKCNYYNISDVSRSISKSFSFMMVSIVFTSSSIGL